MNSREELRRLTVEKNRLEQEIKSARRKVTEELAEEYADAIMKLKDEDLKKMAIQIYLYEFAIKVRDL